MRDLDNIRTDLAAHGQEHLLAFRPQLTEPQQQNLLAEIAAIDFDYLNELIQSHVLRTPQMHLPAGLQPPEIYPAAPLGEDQAREYGRARKRGSDLLAEGKVAAFVVAGGQGTRLGHDGPKGCYPCTPITAKPLFQTFAEQILAATRRYGRAVPWYVMTSPTNDAATREFFRKHGFFGLIEGDVFFLTQGTMPAIGIDGRLLLAEPHRLALSPDGHGGSLTALRTSGALDDMAARGAELISYFQVDNPMTHVLDPLFLGLHAAAGAQMSAKALPKREPLEKLGNFCDVGGRVHVIEYSDMPEDLARQTRDDGRLRFSAGSIAIHIFSRTFVEALTAGGRCRLPLHRAEKKVPCVDASGKPVDPETPNAIKLEMFVFDALPLADRCVILETRRAEEFSPIKNADGLDSPETCKADQVRRAANWLESAGVSVPRTAGGQVDATIEISGLYADWPDVLAEKTPPDLVIAPGARILLDL